MGEPDIDLYADDLDEEFNTDGDFSNDANVDLYDDVIARSDERRDDGRMSSGSSSPHRHLSGAKKRLPVCIGNLTWWTTDKDLEEALHDVGITDLLDVKFQENRSNGQSKGYCITYFASEHSIKLAYEKLPRKEIHGQNPVVTCCSRQNLNYFEVQSRKGTRHEHSNDRSRDRDWDRREFRADSRNTHQEKFKNRVTQPQSYVQRAPSGVSIQHPPPHQGPPTVQYNPSHPWIPPPQIHHLPPQVSRPGQTPSTPTNVPPPPGLQGPPPMHPNTLPPANLRLPPPRGPPPPIAPRNLPVPDTRAPPPQHEWERQHPPQHLGLPPQPQMGVTNRPPPSISLAGQAPPSIPPPGHAPNPHINPAFLQHHQILAAAAAAAAAPPTSQSTEVYRSAPYPEYRPSSSDRPSESSSASSINDSEFEEIMNRNRTVSSSAISRSVADASVGEYATAIETLVTAISLIKQSKVASDERCKILISSLQDTLHGIESKSYGSKSRERARSRERERSRERSSRREKSSRRDRSRSRERDYRDRSRERYREDRYRDKERDHDRDHRSRH